MSEDAAAIRPKIAAYFERAEALKRELAARGGGGGGGGG
eukprot:CAMPEP_0203813922 /NCGR_PEP_ID=MMETSP0115-20131106/4995_1 /ASSEMBLY_ACC=CAM_ASM_000227 /TAXON_ID=33651 /ORGANISM="Bicosoecid sp, Strain ms1" /LENGTH=38 /DNA_ID= /DNA_START= /DNA_END= /DNA_ORIENTATION=